MRCARGLARAALNQRRTFKRHMNSFNALGFLALGSVMNALPALAPSLVDRGAAMTSDLSPGALWLHFMGCVVGLLGSGSLIRDAYAQLTVTRTPAHRPAAVPQRATTPAVLSGSAQQAA